MRHHKISLFLWLTGFILTSSFVYAEGEPTCPYRKIDLSASPSQEQLLRWALLWEYETWQHIYPDDPISPATLDKPALPGGKPYWKPLLEMQPTERLLKMTCDMMDRLEKKGVDVSTERQRLAEYAQLYEQSKRYAEDSLAPGHLYMALRLMKRELMLRDPDLARLQRILFVKRFPYEPSHNYTDHMDSQFKGGGEICILDIPWMYQRLEPSKAEVTTLFKTPDGIPRDPIANYEADTIYFSFRPAGEIGEVYWHIMCMNMDGSGLSQLTDGPYHDYYPCPLPDGTLAFVTTRIECRFLCFVPMAFTLFKMDLGSGNMQPLSYANLTEWGPTVMNDGRILWTRSEYQDKGANFGHTLWTIRPDGTQPELIYGNTTKNCIMNGHEVPNSREYVGTMISHFGDFNGPIALIDPKEGRFNPDAVTNITPDVGYGYDQQWQKYGYKIGTWPDRLCFRDPIPISHDYFLVSHSPSGDWNSPTHLFGLYLIDRYGNREMLYLDPTIGSMAPTPLHKRPTPPVVASSIPPHREDPEPKGRFILTDVYEGLPASVEPGRIKFLRICEELKHNATLQPDGHLQEHYWNFGQHYASPIFKYFEKSEDVDWTDYQDVIGPQNEWPSYVAKGVVGIVPVEEDGSANFVAPAGKVLYFQVLDEDLNEIQRMRSVIQLHPKERRSCIGCHESRRQAPSNKTVDALYKPAVLPTAPPWGQGPFDYQRVVQPIFDTHCISCHNSEKQNDLILTGEWDKNKVPASYRTLITQGLVNYAHWGWWISHEKKDAMTFGVLKSRLIKVIEGGHHDVKLSRDEMHAMKCWIDLNCPLWPDYKSRTERTEPVYVSSVETNNMKTD